MLVAKYTADNQDIKSQYDFIIAKLRATLAKHQVAFPQLATIDKFLGIPMPEGDQAQDYLLRLDELCHYLEELSKASYIIRHLEYNLSADVEAIRNNTFSFDQDEYYIILPR